MLTGRLLFRGEHEAAMVYSIVNEEPVPIERYKPDVSPLLINIIQRALEKDPNDRYQSANDMVIELRRVQKKTSKVSHSLTTQIPSPAPAEAVKTEKVVIKRPFKKIILTGLGAIALLAIVAVVYLILPKHGLPVTLNPDMTFRVLPIPFTEVGHPALSQDGNWAVFPAADVNSKWDLYFMNTTSGESRRITYDSNMSMNDPHISPDGSQVIYSRYRAPINVMEIYIVSSIGGSSKKIVDTGWVPRWRPDGQRIGYLRDKNMGSQSGKFEFWTVKPNGSDNHRELIDSASSQSDYFAWSPNGGSICWNRYLSQKCQELIVYDLSTRISRQITFEDKEISDVCWAPNDQIIFSSNRSGNFNLWMVPASGGPTTQITKGAGPDNSMEISRDGTKLLYRQRQIISHIWIAGTDGSNPRQITFDDASLWRVSFSPDGKEVLFTYARPAGIQDGSYVGSIDRNGRNRRLLTSGQESINNPITSPDSRWIIYGKHSLSSSSDSSMVYLIDAKYPSIPKLVGEGIPIRWIDEKNFVSFDDSTQSTWLYNIEGGAPKKFFEDSTWAIPLQGGNYIGYGDRRSGQQGLWICAAPGVKDPNLLSPRKIESSFYGEFDKSGMFYYYVKNVSELRRISIPSGKEKIIRGVFPGINPSLSWYDISYDGMEIVYTDTRTNSKLIMIENLFK
jgi:Tol biopolymer transport system component